MSQPRPGTGRQAESAQPVHMPQARSQQRTSARPARQAQGAGSGARRASGHRSARRAVVDDRPLRLAEPQARPCDGCGSSRTTAIAMTLTDGSEVLFVSCRDCEGRRWEHGDATLPVQEVLTRARRTR